MSNNSKCEIVLKDLLLYPAPFVAKKILGSYLERSYEDGTKSLVKIVETEAYEQTDVASHSYKGITPRTEVMFGEPGHLYVYFTYGMHYCCNIVVGAKGYGAAILIRAVEPVNGVENLIKNRSKYTQIKNNFDLTNGPAKLCQALIIDKSFNGHELNQAPLKLIYNSHTNLEVVTTTRIGISKGKDMLWRFYIKNNKYVSKI